jgi:hypothetical protein
MSTLGKFGPKLALCGVVCGLGLAGWAGRFSIAQSGVQDAQLPPQAPSGTDERPKAAIPQASPEPLKAEPGSPLLAVPTDALPGSVPADGKVQEPAEVLVPANAPAPPPVVVGPDHSPLEAEDPEKVASDFLEHNHKFAEAQLKALKEEAEKLKARLAKVEAGIKRWDRLVEALKKSGKVTAVEGAVEPAAKNRPPAAPAADQDLQLPRATTDDKEPPRAEPAAKQPDAARPAGAPGDLVPR